MILGTSTLCILAKQERMNNQVIRGNLSSCISDRRTEEIHCYSPEHFKLFKQTFSDFRFAENSRQPWFASLEKFITDTFSAIFLRILSYFAKYCQSYQSCQIVYKFTLLVLNSGCLSWVQSSCTLQILGDITIPIWGLLVMAKSRRF